ncbi:hypothetical protein [Desertivirga xinjiangensis]|uniref:hypothetical protein n=1 Tax=Desertivirga xinjiangensis TaxID=539206 RepID=UPI00210DE77D|nr:hypothetical protein [Pedobacter xinjiangensis]
MKALCILITAIVLSLSIKAQVVIFDEGHFKTVTANGISRYIAEMNYNNNLKTVDRSLNDINLNLTSVILVQSMIRKSLTQIDQALRSGLQIKQVMQISAEVVEEGSRMLKTAGNEPYLLLFAEESARQLKSRGVRLVTEVSEIVLKEGDDVLLNYEKRDALLNKTILELKVMRALCYSVNKSMYWAKVNGILQAANPYRNFINRDKYLIDQILRDKNILKSNL